MIRNKKMDPKLIGQNWAKFMKQQLNQLNSQSTDEELTNNPYYSKYADKLKNVKLNQQSNEQIKLKKELDLGEEQRKFKEQLSEFEKKFEKKNRFDPDNYPNLAGHKSTDEAGQSKDKSLDDIMKLDLIKELDKESIKKLWFEYFKNKDATIFACLDAKQYDRIKENALKYPVFVFLLPIYTKLNEQTADQIEKNNYQFVLVQFNNTKSSLKVHFTPLAFFHAHKENAPATLVLNYFSELKEDKDIVLLEGEYDDKIFNQFEAQCLTNQIQIFYSNQDKVDLLKNFTNNSASFDYMDIVKEFEKSLAI